MKLVPIEGSFSSVGELLQAIDSYLARRNLNPKPYRWLWTGETGLWKRGQAATALGRWSTHRCHTGGLSDLPGAALLGYAGFSACGFRFDPAGYSDLKPVTVPEGSPLPIVRAPLIR